MSVLGSGSNDYLKARCAEALGKLGPAAAAALPVLQEIVEKPVLGSELTAAAREALLRIRGE